MHNYMVNKLMTKEVRICNGEEAVLSVNGVDSYMKMNESRPFSYTIDKLRMVYRFKCKP